VKKKVAQHFIHPSYAHEHGIKADYQRMEFLGDAILNFLVALKLYETFPEDGEGYLSKCRAHLVSKKHLSQKARMLNLDKEILLGAGERKLGGSENERILADTYESYLAHIYLKKGLRRCKILVNKHFNGDFDPSFIQGLFSEDHKSQLQERVQGFGFSTPSYRILEEKGPSHEKVFLTEVCVNDEIKATGEGSSKKEAEQRAAKRALEMVEERYGNKKENR